MTSLDSQTEHVAREAIDDLAPSSASIDRLFVKADAALSALAKTSEAATHDGRRFEFQDFAGMQNVSRSASATAGDQEVDVRIELGRTRVCLEDLEQLRTGSVVPLDKLVAEPVDILVHGHVAARGEVIVMENCFCIRVTEVAGNTAVP